MERVVERRRQNRIRIRLLSHSHSLPYQSDLPWYGKSMIRIHFSDWQHSIASWRQVGRFCTFVVESCRSDLGNSSQSIPSASDSLADSTTSNTTSTCCPQLKTLCFKAIQNFQFFMLLSPRTFSIQMAQARITPRRRNAMRLLKFVLPLHEQLNLISN